MHSRVFTRTIFYAASDRQRNRSERSFVTLSRAYTSHRFGARLRVSASPRLRVSATATALENVHSPRDDDDRRARRATYAIYAKYIEHAEYTPIV